MDAPEYTPTQADWSAVYRDFALARDSTNALVSVAAKPAPAAWRFYWRSEEKGMLLADGKTREKSYQELVRLAPKTQINGMIARDVQPKWHESSTKAYTRVDDMRAAFLCMQASGAQLAAYEFLEVGRPCRFYVDLEWSDAQKPRDETLRECVRVCVRALAAAGIAVSGWSASSSCGPTKHKKYQPSGEKASFHVIFHTSHAFRVAPEAKAFMLEYLKPLLTDAVMWTNAQGQVESCIDFGPYGDTQCFRLPGQSKLGANRFAQPHAFECDGIQGDGAPLLCGLYGAEADGCTFWTPPQLSAPKRKEPQRASAKPAKPAKTPKTRAGAGAGAGAGKAAESADVPVDEGKYPDALLASLIALIPAAREPERFKLFNAIWRASTQEAVESGAARALCMEVLKRADREDARNYKKVDDARSMRYPWGFNTILSEARKAAPDRCAAILEAHCGPKPSDEASAKHDTALERFFAMHSAPAPLVRDARWVEPQIVQEQLAACPTLLLKAALGMGKTTVFKQMCALPPSGLATDTTVLFISARVSFTRSIELDLEAQGFVSYLATTGYLMQPRLIVQAESLWRIPPDCAAFDLVVMDESESVLQAMASLVTHKRNHADNHRSLDTIVRRAKQIIFADAFMTERTAAFAAETRGEMRFVHYTHKPVARIAFRIADHVTKNRRGELGLRPNTTGWFAALARTASDGKRIVVFTQSRGAGLVAEEMLKSMGISCVYYHAHAKREVLDELLDVATAWRKYQVVLYSPALTVGLSYAPELTDELALFHEMFAYFCLESCSPRDCAQALQRVRHLRSGKLTYVMKMSTDKDEDAKEEADADDITISAMHSKLERHAQVAEGVYGAWDAAPAWVMKLEAANKTDKALGQVLFKPALERLLVESGHTLAVICEQTKIKTDVDDLAECDRKWDDVPLISASEFVLLDRRLRCVRLEELEFLQFQKYRFVQAHPRDCAEALMRERWDATIGSDNKSHAGRYAALHKYATRSYEDDSRYAHRATFAHNANLWRYCSAALCSLLKMKHGWEQREIPLAEFELLIPQLQALRESKEFASLARSKEGPLETVDDAVNYLHSEFGNWNGVPVLRPSKVVRQGKKVVRVPGPVLIGSAWWSSFYADIRARFAEDAPSREAALDVVPACVLGLSAEPEPEPEPQRAPELKKLKRRRVEELEF